MTINAEYRPDTYAGDGANDTFAIALKSGSGSLFDSTSLLPSGNIKVSIKVDSTGVITEKTESTHYTVSGTNVVFSGGNIPASGETIIVEINPPFTQEVDYVENDSFPAETHESALDKATFQSQLAKDSSDRSIKFDAGVDLSSFTSTIPAITADRYLGINAAGTALELKDVAAAGAIALPVTVSNGGTGVTSFTANSFITGQGTGALQAESNLSYDGITITFNDVVAIESDIHHIGDTDNKFSFTTDTQTFQTGGSTRMDITNSGVQLGGSGARVTTILDEDTMSTDSATALATQQSIKAYVDATSQSGAFLSVQVFTASGTWTKPAGVNSVLVHTTGGGGAGGGGDATLGGAGGAAAGTCIEFIDVSGTSSESVTVGAGGTGVSNGTGGTGGTSSFGAYHSAVGGSGGAVNSGGPSGGTASGGDVNTDGGDGGVVRGSLGGNGGDSYWGGGAGAPGSGSSGNASAVYGAGASGASGGAGNPHTGGNGGGGIVVVYEYS